MTASLAPASKSIYTRAWRLFEQFAIVQGFPPAGVNVAPYHIALFVAHMHHRKSSPKTISTYLSAVAYIHKLLHNVDPTDSFLVRKLVAGCYRLNPSVDMRLPITVGVLNNLLRVIQHVSKSVFEATLFRAMFLFAFSTFARVGEIAATDTARNLIQFQHVTISKTQSDHIVQVDFYHFKHNLQMKRHTITFSHGPANISAIQALNDYITYRGTHNGPIFLLLNQTPVQRAYFDRMLKSCLDVAGLDSSVYKGHSFRIGAASYWSQRGMSDSQIRACGRWSSNAFKKYIRSSTSD